MEQKKLKIEENTINRIYINWNNRNKKTGKIEPIALLFKEPDETKPFKEQEPIRKIVTEELKKILGIKE